MISNDIDNFVVYSRYEGKFTVTKALFEGNDDTEELYTREIEFQEYLAERGFAPKLLNKNVKALHKSRMFQMWISEDAGLPIQETDVQAANTLLANIRDAGVILGAPIHKSLFVKGFDGKIRVTDFKHSEWVKNSKSPVEYLQWTDS